MHAERFYDQVNAALDRTVGDDLDRELTLDEIAILRRAIDLLFGEALADHHERQLAAAKESVHEC